LAQAADAPTPQLLVVGSEYSEKYGPQVVISQSPRAGRVMNGYAGVRVRLSRGSAIAEVPDIPIGSSLVKASRTLGHLGFGKTVNYAPSWTVPREGVVSISPSPGTRLRRPGLVTVTLSQGVPTANVPDVRGDSLSMAESVLQNVGLHSSTTYESAPDSTPGTVIRQSPTSGTLKQGDTVQLVVASQPEWRTILTQSGTGPYRSPALKLPPKARIRYRAGPDENEFGGGFISVDLDGYLDAFQPDCGKTGTYNLHEAGTHQVDVDTFGCKSWWIAVDAFQ
jgi:beta-lactam-binding protein with PASTA domain